MPESFKFRMTAAPLREVCDVSVTASWCVHDGGSWPQVVALRQHREARRVNSAQRWTPTRASAASERKNGGQAAIFLTRLTARLRRVLSYLLLGDRNGLGGSAAGRGLMSATAGPFGRGREKEARKSAAEPRRQTSQQKGGLWGPPFLLLAGRACRSRQIAPLFARPAARCAVRVSNPRPSRCKRDALPLS